MVEEGKPFRRKLFRNKEADGLESRRLDPLDASEIFLGGIAGNHYTVCP